jgi:hypothetical protein
MRKWQIGGSFETSSSLCRELFLMQKAFVVIEKTFLLLKQVTSALHLFKEEKCSQFCVMVDFHQRYGATVILSDWMRIPWALVKG